MCGIRISASVREYAAIGARSLMWSYSWYIVAASSGVIRVGLLLNSTCSYPGQTVPSSAPFSRWNLTSSFGWSAFSMVVDSTIGIWERSALSTMLV